MQLSLGIVWRLPRHFTTCRRLLGGVFVNFLPPLELKDERKLLERGTKNALDQLVLHNLKEAVLYAQKCSRGGLSETELVSLCWVAMRQAADNYRTHKSKGIRFFAYCKAYIRGQINAERKQKIVVRSGEFDLNILDLDGIVEEVTVAPDFSNLESKELLAGLKPAIFSALDEREIAILILRYESGFSFTEIGERIGFSRQSIQKSHCKALIKLRSALQEKKGELLTFSH